MYNNISEVYPIIALETQFSEYYWDLCLYNTIIYLCQFQILKRL